MNKPLFTLLAFILSTGVSLAQKKDSVVIIKRFSKDTLIINADTLLVNTPNFLKIDIDTLKVGEVTIVTRTDKGSEGKTKKVEVTINGDLKVGDVVEKTLEKINENKKPKNIESDWMILDLGFSRFNDASNYAQAQQLGFVGAGIGPDQLKVKTRFASNVNIWLVMQRMNLIQHKVNLKYGIGLELNNYHFDQENVLLQKNPTRISLLAGNLPKKVKLAADYLTIPMMLHFNTNPATNKGLQLSAGASAGFLYSARYKTKSNGDVSKVRSDFELEPFKFSWVGEIGIRGLTLYGSFAMNNMWNKALDMKPYSIGFRLGGTDHSDRKKNKKRQIINLTYP